MITSKEMDYPQWGEKFEFEVAIPEMSMLRLACVLFPLLCVCVYEEMGRERECVRVCVSVSVWHLVDRNSCCCLCFMFYLDFL